MGRNRNEGMMKTSVFGEENQCTDTDGLQHHEGSPYVEVGSYILSNHIPARQCSAVPFKSRLHTPTPWHSVQSQKGMPLSTQITRANLIFAIQFRHIDS